MKIKKFGEFFLESDMAHYFIENLKTPLMEDGSKDKESFIKDIVKKISKDLKLNLSIVTTYGTGITMMYPIILNLVNNSSLNIDVTPEKIILLLLTSFTIIYMEEKDPTNKKMIKDSKSMLEELKLNGIGNGIVKKTIKSIKSIKSIFDLIFKNSGKIIKYITDMFIYTSFLIPFLNAVSAVVGKYDLNIDTLPGNFIAISVGIGTIIAKHGVSYIIDKLKGKFKVNKKEILKSIEVEKGAPKTTQPWEIPPIGIELGSEKTKAELIKEQ